MADYQEANVSGKSWHRFGRIVIDNPRNGVPTILCVEQEVTSLGEKEIVRDIGNLGFVFDPNAVIPILDPTTMQPTGQTISGTELYVSIFSAVMQQAAIRDAALPE